MSVSQFVGAMQRRNFHIPDHARIQANVDFWKSFGADARAAAPKDEEKRKCKRAFKSGAVQPKLGLA